MKNTLKKTLSIILAILMIATTVPVAFAATSGTVNDTVNWSYSNGKLTISGTGAIPGYSWGGAPWWSGNYDSIIEVEIQSGITSIGNYALSGLIKAERMTLPDTLETIGNYAFCDMSALTTVTIPSGVKTIGERAFENCSVLSSEQ